MIPISLHKIAIILKAKHIGMNCVIHSISIHSNCIDSKCMFIALLGKRFDGHNFVKQAIFFGATALLVNRFLSLDVPQLIVPDTRIALIMLANWVCRKSSVRVIAITGSSGKTSVKDMTASILQRCGRVIATKNNLNNIIGVSITLLRLTKKDDFVIFELGLSFSGEIDQLMQIVAVDVALVNNIFPAHISGFGSLHVIKQEKGKIFLGLSTSGIGVINLDNHALHIWNRVLKGKTVWKFSVRRKMGADFFATDIVSNACGTRFMLHTPCGISLVSLSMLGHHNIANALAASALSFSAGATLSQIVFGLENAKISLGRLFPIILGKNRLLIDDTYNVNIGSMISAIRVLQALPGHKILITSDMLELGKYRSIKYHRYVGKYIAKTSINQVFTVGEISYFLFKSCKKEGRHFLNKMKLIMYVQDILYRYSVFSILVKGSRAFKMEKIVRVIRDKIICYFGL